MIARWRDVRVVLCKVMELPRESYLSVEHLSSTFNNTTNSYKFYWFLAIIEKVKEGKELISIDDLVILMISEVWYPVNYFRLSFGKQDQFEDVIKNLRNKLNCSIDIKRNDLIILLYENKNHKEVKKLIRKLRRWVPQRFIRPWFSIELRGTKDQFVNSKIIQLSNIEFNKVSSPPLYKFVDDDKILLHPEWIEYLLKNIGIVVDFTFWNLLKYLQQRNPNVANISVKLFPPSKRDLSTARKFWNLYFDKKPSVLCIYSNTILEKHDYSLDHYLPWSYTGHDKLWNLIPTKKSINSSKSNSLPDDKYIKKFTHTQYDALQTLAKGNMKSQRLLEDYCLLFNKSTNEILSIDYNTFDQMILDNITPQMQIAKNMGFDDGWVYGR